jgi:hypothetical protein
VRHFRGSFHHKVTERQRSIRVIRVIRGSIPSPSIAPLRETNLIAPFQRFSFFDFSFYQCNPFSRKAAKRKGSRSRQIGKHGKLGNRETSFFFQLFTFERVSVPLGGVRRPAAPIRLRKIDLPKLDSMVVLRRIDGAMTKNNVFMQTSPMRIVGSLLRTPWQRFIRLQRTSALLLAGKGQPKGVYRFASYEECTAWKTSRTVN